MLLATVALSQIPPPSFGIAAPPTFLQLDAAPGYVDGRTPLTARDLAMQRMMGGWAGRAPAGGRHRHRRDGASHQRRRRRRRPPRPTRRAATSARRARPTRARARVGAGRRRRAPAPRARAAAADPARGAGAGAGGDAAAGLFPKLKVPPALVNGMNPAFASMLAKPGGFHSRQVTGARRRQLALQPAQNYRL